MLLLLYGTGNGVRWDDAELKQSFVIASRKRREKGGRTWLLQRPLFPLSSLPFPSADVRIVSITMTCVFPPRRHYRSTFLFISDELIQKKTKTIKSRHSQLSGGCWDAWRRSLDQVIISTNSLHCLAIHDPPTTKKAKRKILYRPTAVAAVTNQPTLVSFLDIDSVRRVGNDFRTRCCRVWLLFVQ